MAPNVILMYLHCRILEFPQILGYCQKILQGPSIGALQNEACSNEVPAGHPTPRVPASHHRLKRAEKRILYDVYCICMGILCYVQTILIPCVFIRIHTYIYIYMSYVCMYTYIYIYANNRMYGYACIYIYIYLSTYMYRKVIGYNIPYHPKMDS